MQSVTTNKTNIKFADFHKIEEANKYGLTVAEKTKIDTMSMADLKAKYSSVIGNYNTYIGTGYFNLLANGENRAVIERYKILKAEEEAKIAAKAAEMNKYHYLNLYKTIAETGLRPNGTPATDSEKKIAPYVVPIGSLFEAGKSFAVAYSAYVGYQNYYGKPIYGVDTNWSGQPSKPGTVSTKTLAPPFGKNVKPPGSGKAADKLDDVAGIVKAVDRVDDVDGGAKVVRSGSDNVKNPLENVVYTDKVKRQMEQGDFHSFPEAVDSFGSDGKITKIIGGDGIERTKVEISGSYKGRYGIFEYIIEPNNTVNHRFFRPN
ncbi:hypothetical protein RFG22_08935 [Streptococcus ruminantium]|nr:hypothetical protein [Streptococcus ruminantium]MDQ8767810.1 hypothetical protein [Streptococcus ruminantium]MDQ8780885.1 hypothetical protein [Streptococcus ruminantium]